MIHKENITFQVVKDSHLFGLVFGVMAVDLVILILWIIIDPVKLQTIFLPEQVNRFGLNVEAKY